MPWIVLPAAPTTVMPLAKVLPLTTLRAAAVVPPMRLFAEFDEYAAECIGASQRAARIDADVVAFDHVAGADQDDAGALNRLMTRPRTVLSPPLQGQAIDRDVVPVDLDDRRPGEIGLGRAVDDDRTCNVRQRRGERDRVRTRAWDVEADRVRGCKICVGVQQRLPERSRAAVVGVGDELDDRSGRDGTAGRELRGVVGGIRRRRRNGVPTVVSGMLAVKLALPVPSVVTDIEPRRVCPSPFPDPSHAAFEKNSRRNVVFALLFRVPRIVVTVAAHRRGAEQREVLQLVRARCRCRPHHWP